MIGIDDEIELNEEEIADLVKLMFHASNGLAVAFCGLFNIIATGTASKEDAYNSIDRLMAALKCVIDDVYNGTLKTTRISNGVIHSDFVFRGVTNNKLN